MFASKHCFKYRQSSGNSLTMQFPMAGIQTDKFEHKSAFDSPVAISRKDTIIIAMLVNMALLFVLFATATKPQPPVTRETNVAASERMQPDSMAMFAKNQPTNTQQTKNLQTKSQPATDSQATSSRLPIDEIDEILQQYVSTHASTPEVEQGVLQERIQKDEEEPSLASKNNFVEVKVQKGDALAKIAKTHGTTVAQLLATNQLENPKLKIGQVLKVPTNTPTTTSANTNTNAKPAKQKAAATSTAEYYIVKSGDNPWKIAKKFNLKFEDLLQLNDLDEEKARNLKIGQKLRIK